MSMAIVEQGTDHTLGSISGVLIDPDTGKIEGFFVGNQDFVSSLDIVRFGARVYVSHSDCIAPAEDRVRLQALLKDPRHIIGQKIVYESGKTIGTCTDIQFTTKTMHIEWLFPRRFFKEGRPIPVSDVIEVTANAIIVSDPDVKAPIQEEELTSALADPSTPVLG